MNWREWPVQVIPTLFVVAALLFVLALIEWQLSLFLLLLLLFTALFIWFVEWFTDPEPTTIGQWLKRRKERRDD